MVNECYVIVIERRGPKLPCCKYVIKLGVAKIEGMGLEGPFLPLAQTFA